jgi:hypothetical protein
VFPINVTIISVDGPRAVASTTAANPTTQATVTVTEPPITDVTTPEMAVSAVAGETFTGIVGAFTEFAQAPVTDFTATIKWGDGTQSAGTVAVAAANDGSFTVSGSHAYAHFGNYVISVTVVDTASPTTPPNQGELANTAAISDATLTGQGASISTVAVIPFTGQVATFNTPNLLAVASEYAVTINWGDGTALDTRSAIVTGASGSFKVIGSHTYAVPSPSYVTTVTITHTSPFASVGGTTLTVQGSARVLAPLIGAMSRASDSGVSNTDGITRITTPVFAGTGQPGATVKLSTGGTVVGTTTVTAAGTWSVQVSPLGDGSHVFTASMLDPNGGGLVQTSVLPVTPAGGKVLLVDTAGPTVAGVTFIPSLGRLQVVIQDSLSGPNPAGMLVAGNFQLAAPTATGLAPYAVRNISAVNAPGVSVVTVNYNLGSKVRTGAYVVTLKALGLTDLAGNTLVEKKLVAFPQTSNSPNPNYIAEIDVAANGSTSAPTQYVSLAEKQAAASYASFANARKVIRVPPRPLPAVVLRASNR